MNKTLLTINALLLFAVSSFAQLDAGRTSKTKLADALAQMPAKNVTIYNQAMQDLTSTGEAGILDLIKMRETAEGDGKVKLDYAINSLSAYISGTKNAQFINMMQSAIMKAIPEAKTPESAAFYLKQLNLIGNDESVLFLKSYLKNEKLSGYAARALKSIGSPKAIDALSSSLNEVPYNFKKNIINALGELNATQAEDAILAQRESLQPQDLRVLYYALGRCGSVKSMKLLEKGASQAGYTLDKDGITESYITLLKRLADNDASKSEAKKASAALLKNATKANQTGTRCAALTLLVKLDGENASKTILSALKDNNCEYRNKALRLAAAYNNEELNNEIIAKIKKSKAPLKKDLIEWVGVNRLASALPLVVSEFKNTNPEIAAVAMASAAKIGGDEAVEALCSVVNFGTKENVDMAKNTLLYTSGNISDPLMKNFDTSSVEGKVAALQLVAKRKADAYADKFITLCSSSDVEVSKCAAENLAEVVTSKNLPELYKMLGTTAEASVAPVQKAVIAAVKTLPAEKRFESVNAQMKSVAANLQPRYYTILASTNDPKALNEISNALNSVDPRAKQSAFSALTEWNGFEAAEPLYNICKTSKNDEEFNKAFDAYTAKVSAASMPGEEKLIFLRKALEIAKNKAQKAVILNKIQGTNTFLGLMTAGKYLDDKEVQQDACQAVMNIALNNKQFTGKEVNALLNKVVAVINNPDADYQKQAIQKHLGEQPKEDGFISIFNGKDLTGWKGLVGNPVSRAKMTKVQLSKAQATADEVAAKTWTVENGLLIFNGKGDNLCTTKQYGDFEMYVDWLLYPEGPEADAGIYLRGTPQVQIWDTARVNVGAQVGSGGLYNNQKHLSKPLSVADNKLGEWNSFYIKMVGERVTVILNGVKVVDNVIMENYWDRNQPIPMLDQIELQAHGSKVAYRDIYVREIPRVEPFTLSKEEQKEGFKVLFDGTSMINWTGNTKDYVVEDGCIVLYPQNGGGGNLYTVNEYSDFNYRFEFMLTPGANNGLGIRTPLEGDAAYVGMELQILDNEDPIYATLQKYQYHGSVYGVIPAKRGFLKPTGEWNTEEVIAKGNKIKVILNGTVILDGDIKEAGGNGTMDHRDHPGLFNKKGHIGFLGHGSHVKFRNIRVKEL
ncbi:MAG: DUF1080 domain-containing protein [Bacteroidales bacterium]|nr:DUF1080 domain-containing protein [Bacteroidales bacterium]